MSRVVQADVRDSISVSDREKRPAVMPPNVLRAQYVAELAKAPDGVPQAKNAEWLRRLRDEAREKGVQLVEGVYVPMLPVGWRIMLIPLKVDEMSDGGIALPDAVQRNNALLEYRGWVVAMGPHCYKDRRWADQKPWCQLGDIVAYLPYESATYNVNLGGKQARFILINDDDVRAVIVDPTVLKAYV